VALAKMIAQLVPPVERLGASRLGTGMNAACVLFHVPAILTGTTKGDLAAVTHQIRLTGRLRLAADHSLARAIVLQG
jgi:protein-arginine kinase